ncbi:hypothetical protein VTI28DRAFT_2189 [Corynascus sepedonium]
MEESSVCFWGRRYAWIACRRKELGPVVLVPGCVASPPPRSIVPNSPVGLLESPIYRHGGRRRALASLPFLAVPEIDGKTVVQLALIEPLPYSYKQPLFMRKLVEDYRKGVRSSDTTKNSGSFYFALSLSSSQIITDPRDSTDDASRAVPAVGC